jgi:hypothetical protein
MPERCPNGFEAVLVVLISYLLVGTSAFIDALSILRFSVNMFQIYLILGHA